MVGAPWFRVGPLSPQMPCDSRLLSGAAAGLALAMVSELPDARALPGKRKP